MTSLSPGVTSLPLELTRDRGTNTHDNVSPRHGGGPAAALPGDSHVPSCHATGQPRTLLPRQGTATYPPATLRESHVPSCHAAGQPHALLPCRGTASRWPSFVSGCLAWGPLRTMVFTMFPRPVSAHKHPSAEVPCGSERALPWPACPAIPRTPDQWLGWPGPQGFPPVQPAPYLHQLTAQVHCSPEGLVLHLA